MTRFTVGFLGPSGTYSELAVNRLAAENRFIIDKLPLASFDDCFTNLRSGNCHKIVIPIENSVEGSVLVNLDHLLNFSDINQPNSSNLTGPESQKSQFKGSQLDWKTPQFVIESEILLEISHSILANPSDTIDSITDIISHPQALAQCNQNLRRLFPTVTFHWADSTAAPCDQLPPHWAAVGNNTLANQYPVSVLVQNITDFRHNVTRFIVMGKTPSTPTASDKTSIIFTPHHNRPGSLYDMLGEFAARKINLTKIESRPQKTALGNYWFFIDFDGHIAAPDTAAALHSIESQATDIRFLGSYPKGVL